MTRRMLGAVLGVACLALSGCMSWKSGWEAKVEKAEPGADAIARVQAAEALAPQADTLAGLRADIRAWQAVLAAEASNERALLRLSSNHALMGLAYAESVGQAGEHWRKALQYAERAMALEPAFRQAVGNGAQVWDAVQVLGPERSDAIVLWLDAVRLYFQFGQSGVVRMTNAKWPDRMARVLDRLETLGTRPASVLVGRGYLAMARSNGKDIEAAAALFDQAVALASDCVKPRWARAKFLNVPAGLRDAAIADLDWVLARGGAWPEGPGASPIADVGWALAPGGASSVGKDAARAAAQAGWNAFFQADARRMRDALR